MRKPATWFRLARSSRPALLHLDWQLPPLPCRRLPHSSPADFCRHLADSSSVVAKTSRVEQLVSRSRRLYKLQKKVNLLGVGASAPVKLLQPLCRLEKSQPLWNQANPASFCKTPGVGVPQRLCAELRYRHYPLCPHSIAHTSCHHGGELPPMPYPPVLPPIFHPTPL